VTRVFFAVLKEISIANKNGDVSKSLHPTTLSDGSYVCYDDEEFMHGVIDHAQAVLKERRFRKKWYQRKGYTYADVIFAIRVAMIRKTTELRNMTIRVP